MTSNEADQHGSQAQFAHFMGTSGTQVGRWKKADRLVLTADGKVDFAASKARIEGTTTAPERLGIFSAARAGTREEKDRLEIHRMRLDLDERAGQLTETQRVADAASAAGAVLRARAENMPYILSPQLAAASGGDEERCRAILVAWVEGFLAECATAMAGIAAAVKVRK
jgi:hypothetical protein